MFDIYPSLVFPPLSPSFNTHRSISLRHRCFSGRPRDVACSCSCCTVACTAVSFVPASQQNAVSFAMEALLRDGEAALAELDAAFAEDPLMCVSLPLRWLSLLRFENES